MSRGLSPTFVWVVLVGATLVSFAAFELDTGPGAHAVPVILAVAAIKGRLILRQFMELRDGPRGHRLVFDAWTFGCAALIAGVHWWSGG